MIDIHPYSHPLAKFKLFKQLYAEKQHVANGPGDEANSGYYCALTLLYITHVCTLIFSSF
jgi:hypothetical protein